MPPEASAVTTSLDLVGWSVLVVLPVAVLVVWLALMAARRELAHVARGPRRSLMTLRASACGLLVFFLLEPACTRTSQWQEAPELAVLIDRSASMATADAGGDPTRRLDELLALEELDDIAGRDEAARDAATAVADLRAALGPLRSALRATADEAGDGGPRRRRLDGGRRALDDIHTRLERQAVELVGTGEIEDQVRAWAGDAAAAAGAMDDAEGDTRERSAAAVTATRLLEDWDGAGALLTALEAELRARQREADAALIAAAGPDEALGSALATNAERSRLERAARLVQKRLVDGLDGQATVTVHTMDPDLGAVDTAALVDDPASALAALGPRTDLSGALSAMVARPGGSGGHLAGVVVVCDGRITAGGDAAPAARALAARGAPVHGLVLGDTEPPRDAVVAAIVGSTEVFKDETVRLDVRFRIVGDDQPYQLILSKDGEELERRPVSGTGSWQRERFEFPAEDVGLISVDARLERDERTVMDTDAQRGLFRERWSGTDVYRRIDTDSELPEAKLSEVTTEDVDRVDHSDQYTERFRGWLVPRRSGGHVFSLAADDQARLLLGTGPESQTATMVADVPSYTGPDDFDRHPTQVSATIELRAGQPYWFDLRHLQGTGDGHLRLRWREPDTNEAVVVPAAVLIPWSSAGLPQTADAEEGVVPEASLDNNAARLAIRVSEDPLRVLVVDHRPRWETRYLVALLERDRRTTIDRRYLAVNRPRGLRDVLPTEPGALDRFDAIVLGDISPDDLADGDQERIQRFVANRGGFLLVLAGPRAMPSSFALGPFADLLPVTPSLGGASSSTVGNTAENGPENADGVDADGSSSVGMRLGPDGVDEPMVQILDDDDRNTRLWTSLPALQWMARGLRAKPGARVLVESDEADAEPLVAVARFGGGRVCFVGSDETWRWRDRLADRVHQTFWLQVLRWGLGMRLRGAEGDLQVALAETMLEPGQATEIRARSLTEDGSVLTDAVHVLFERLDEAGEPIPGTAMRRDLVPVPDGEGLARLPIAGLAEGRWRLTVASDDPALEGREEVRELLVQRQASSETVELTADPDGLRDLLAVPRNDVAEAGAVDALIERIGEQLEPRSRTQVRTASLWNNPLPLVLVLLLFIIEWLWRKRLGLP